MVQNCWCNQCSQFPCTESIRSPPKKKRNKNQIGLRNDILTKSTMLNSLLVFKLCVYRTKDGENLGDVFYRFKQDGKTHSLIIDDVLPEDEGTYIATATNPVGRAECTIQITVNGTVNCQTVEILPKLFFFCKTF